MNWKDALKLPASGQVQYLRYLIESRPMLGARIPDQSLIVGGPPSLPEPATGSPQLEEVWTRSKTLRPRSASKPAPRRRSSGSYAFIYLPAGQTKVTVDLSKLAPGALNTWWYDPRTGKATKFGTITEGKTHEFVVPAPTDKTPSLPKNEWVLVFDFPSKNFPEPG